MNKLTTTESARLDKLEKIIKAGERTFIEVGDALTEIRDKKLYRSDHSTFEKYCAVVWGWGASRGRQLCIAAAVAGEIKSVTKVTLSNEAAARAVAKLPPPRRAEVVREIADSGRIVTAKEVAKAAGKPPARPVAAILDGTGLPIPKEVLPLWNRLPEVQELLTMASVIIGALGKAQEDEDILFSEVDFTDCIAHLKQAYADIKCAKPFAVCPSCAGKLPKDCATCTGRGFVSGFYWKHNVPEDLKITTGRK
jgi:alkylated DNA nucleotide flippase Atl1